MYRIIVCGSTQDSVLILDAIKKTSQAYMIAAVVTQPPKPVGRNKIMTPTPVQQWAEKNKISILTFPQDKHIPWHFADEQAVTNSVLSFKPDLLVTAVFGQKIPQDLLTHIPFGGINIHPSLLPRWRGADPMPWTILSGDAQTGVTVSQISDHMDEGAILAQKKYPVTDKETPDALRTTLFTIGAELLMRTLPTVFSASIKPTDQKEEDVMVARKMKREDGYLSWELICDAIEGKDYTERTLPKTETNPLLRMTMKSVPSSTSCIERMFRALAPWPGVWTTIETTGSMRKTREIIGKRLKLLDLTVKEQKLVPVSVQLEGKTPVSWDQFSKAYLQ